MRTALLTRRLIGTSSSRRENVRRILIRIRLSGARGRDDRPTWHRFYPYPKVKRTMIL
jgi:hypothetical protein